MSWRRWSLGAGAVLCAVLVYRASGAFLDGSAAPPDDLMLVVLAGQSNMSGRGPLADLPTGFPVHADRLWVFDNADQWHAAREPVDSAKGQVDAVSADPDAEVGPGLAFADALVDALPEARIGLIPCAKGGTSVDEWQPAKGSGTLYGSCARRIAETCGKGLVVGVLWHQGESDAYSRAAATAWPAGFARVVEAWRRDLKAPHLPVVAATIGVIADFRQDDNRFTYWNDVVAAQRHLDLPDVTMLNGQDIEMDPEDGLHFSTRGQLELGKRMAAALMRVDFESVSADPCSITAD